jgi:lipoic acid synthetase
VKSETRLPEWLTKPLSDPEEMRPVRRTLAAHRLNTVCDEARCPNRVECFAAGTATFMILGDHCTRDCRFCAVSHDDPRAVDRAEPEKVAMAAADLGLDFVVVTSVTRDDLPDGGAAHFAETVRAVRRAVPGAGVEVLVPDFGGSRQSVVSVLEASPEVFGHNVETVERLYNEVRRGADYRRSLEVLSMAAESGSGSLVKTALMLGVGETRGELTETLEDVRAAGAEIVYLGQYLRPSAAHHPVARFVPPEEFEEIREICLSMGFAWVSAGPFVRSSYRAHEAVAALDGHRADTHASTR